jgi:hypothetical protein
VNKFPKWPIITEYEDGYQVRHQDDNKSYWYPNEGDTETPQEILNYIREKDSTK